MLGNDVVDLCGPGAPGKSSDGRFIRRVFTARERRWILAAPGEADLRLWMLWAAKEAAFKALGRPDPSLVFAHRRFEVFPGDDLAGTVRAGGAELEARWQVGRGWVHCLVSPAGAWDAVRFAVEPGGGSESQDVRKLARRIWAERTGTPLSAIEIARPADGAPVILNRGTPVAGAIVSLAHHGRWVAAAVGGIGRRPEGPKRDERRERARLALRG